MRRSSLITFFSFFLLFQSFAQEIRKGIVVDETNNPIAGVSVQVQSSNKKSQTDNSGQFSLGAKIGETLVFTFVGYNTQTIKISNNDAIRIVLSSVEESLDEVVVIGYGTARKRDLTGAVSSIKGNEIKDVPVTTVAQALTGKVSGVSVVTQSGAPGAPINITVRGATSITGDTNPLYIVDGFEMPNALSIIDVNDIESIDVLKDASASAIYGSRGANGVILITTKSAKSGKTIVDYNGYASFEGLSKKLDLLNTEDFVKYQYELLSLAGRQTHFANLYGGDATSPNFGSTVYSMINEKYASDPGLDWQEEVFGGTAVLQNHNVNVSGGTDKTKLMFSYNNVGQDGILAKSGYQRNSVRAKLNHQLAQGVSLDVNSFFQDAKTQGGGSLGGMLKMSILQPRTGGLRFTNEELLTTDIAEEMQMLDSQYDIYNPIIVNDAVSRNRANRTANINAGLTVKFLEDFTFRTSGSYQWTQTRSDFFDDGRTIQARNNKGPYGSVGNAEAKQWQISSTLSWNKTFGNHNLNLMGGHEVLSSNGSGIDHTYYGFPTSNFGLKDVSLADRVERAETSISRYGLVSGFARALYNYDDRYLLTATMRADGVSRFIKGSQWGSFPSASAAWNIHKESFMEDNTFFDQLKLRVGYGTTGNEKINDNAFYTVYSSVVVGNNNQEGVGLAPGNTLGNPALVWEKTKTSNIALDLAFFNNRVNLSADFYVNKSENLLMKATIPTSTGYTFQFQNVAALQNRGMEFVLRTNNIRKESFQWNSNFNVSFNRAKIQDLFGSAGSDYMLTNESSRIDFISRVGETVGLFYGYKYDGVYTTDDFTQNSDGSYILKAGVASLKGANRTSVKPGDVKYQTINGDTDANGNPVWSTADRGVIGNPEPKFFGGFANEFVYKNFDLNIFLNFVYGNKAFNMNTQRYMGPYLPNQNSLSNMANRFTLIDPNTGLETKDLNRLAELNPNQHDKDQIWSLNSTNKIAITDALDYYLEDASFLRVNNITLGYTLPTELSKKAFVSKLRVYMTLNNIHTFTNYSGYDPEVASSSSLLTRGVDNSAYPRAKSVVAGINLTF
ncbi:TonB-dependent receptor [Sphingobacterium sp. WQ 366]|uniref:TonB-dependent receptor n=2 Tax=Sphingobacterium bovistauri TaxID=2781959 RepID=A0ABS7Z127_9SPHI|nr:TonB-dependent receptor [Sphingobacterium bovistauri]